MGQLELIHHFPDIRKLVFQLRYTMSESTTEITPELQAAIEAYEAKRAARVERFREYSANAGRRSNAAYNRQHSMLSGIPFGQPVLVGHHSERCHRNALRRADNLMRKSCEERDKAKYYEDRADSAESNDAIFSDDPAALIKLREKIADLEQKQEERKAINKALRSKNQDQALAALGHGPEAIAKIKTPNCMGYIGFPSYSLQNNNANITRLKKRLSHLERCATIKPVEQSGNGVTVSYNPVNYKLEIRFDRKPSPETIAALKSRYWVLRRKDGEWFWMNGRTDEAKAFAASLLA